MNRVPFWLKIGKKVHESCTFLEGYAQSRVLVNRKSGDKVQNTEDLYWEHILRDSNGNIVEIRKGKKEDFSKEIYTDGGYRVPYGKKGYTCFDLMITRTFEDDREYCQLGILCHHWLVEGNIIGYHSGSNTRYCKTIKDIARVSGRSERQLKSVISYAKKKNLVVKHNGKYYINPAHFLKNGQRVTPVLFVLFEEDVKRIVTPTFVAKLREDAKRLGLLGGQQ